MQLRVCRSASVAACAAVLAAAAAGSAQAAVVPTTGAASSVTATTATLTGSVNTAGKVTQWEFGYSLTNNPFAGSGFTPGGIIPAGTTAATPVTDMATGLMPSMSYTYQLVATDVTLGTNYYLLSPQYGGLLSFTTKGPGSASLVGSKLKVKKGKVATIFKCGTSLACAGGMLTITTRIKHKSVTCASAMFNVNAGSKKTVKSNLSHKCKTALAASTNGKLKAKLSASFTYQKAISKSVTLKSVS